MPESVTSRRILVTGAGANPGINLVRSLLRLGHEVVAADANPLAPGFLLPGVRPWLTPLATDPGYGDALLTACREMSVEGVAAGIENDLPPLVGLRPRLEAEGVRTWLPDADSVHRCIDKALFHRTLSGSGIPTPDTWLPEEGDAVPDGEKLVVKPRKGHGAQGVHFVNRRDHALLLCGLAPGSLIQRRVHGREFTADCLVDDGGRSSCVLRYRNLVKAGLAVVSTTFHSPHVTDAVERTLAATGARGLCCVQGFLSAGGEVIITELNARAAGGFPLAEAAGADLTGQMLNGLFGDPVDHIRLTYRADVTLVSCTQTLAAGDTSTLLNTAAKEALS